MLKMKGFAAEDLNGFLDEGTEFSGELRFRDVMRVDGRVKGRIVSDNTLIIGETGPGGRRDRLRGGLDPRPGHRPGARPPAHRAALRLPGAGDARLPEAAHRGRGVLPGRLPHGRPDGGGPSARPAPRRAARPRMVLCIPGELPDGGPGGLAPL